uniref:RNase H type-1 domain-containing protein n=1 Tax=Cannabis sativa TaxID=3483 RepID=A0A803QSB3_CANSA
MSVFLLTKEICSSLEGLMAKFWWKSQSKNVSKGVSWMSWRKLCRHKDAGGLGFRNLRDYNLSFLGKLGWWLLTNNNSLVAKVYKARYYPKGDFLTAELGPNPSFIWRSVLEAKSLLQMGVSRSIGDGKATSILADPWLPDLDNKFVTTYHPSLVGRTVDSLLQMERKAWDVEVINDIFNPHDSALILSIQMCDSRREDCWSWSKETSGIYSVRSAYKLLQRTNGDWPIAGVDSYWKKIWQLNVPAKVQHLLWRVIAGCLPTKIQLSNRHVHVDLTCPMCNLAPETASHVLFSCNFAHSCWNLSCASAAGVGEELFLDWFCDLLVHGSRAVAEDAAMLLWRIWTARNDQLWNNKSTTVLEVIQSARTNLGTWQNAQSNGSFPLLNVNFGNGKEHWTKPISTKLKINVDGAIFESENRFGFGFIRDSTGKFVQAVSGSRLGVVSPEIAEVVGMKEVLSWIKTMQVTDVEVETDSLVTVQAINGSVQIPSQFGLIVQDCRLLLSELQDVFISFVKRSVNRAAHCIARQSCFMSDCMFDEFSAPSNLLSIVRDDISSS